MINLHFIAFLPSSSIPTNCGAQPVTASHSLRPLQQAPSVSARKGRGAHGGQAVNREHVQRLQMAQSVRAAEPKAAEMHQSRVPLQLIDDAV